jgi:hypothetical protein
VELIFLFLHNRLAIRTLIRNLPNKVLLHITTALIHLHEIHHTVDREVQCHIRIRIHQLDLSALRGDNLYSLLQVRDMVLRPT